MIMANGDGGDDDGDGGDDGYDNEQCSFFHDENFSKKLQLSNTNDRRAN